MKNLIRVIALFTMAMFMLNRPAFSQQDEEQRILDLKRDMKSIENTKPYQRMQWWHQQRAYPNEKMEQGYLLRAYQQSQQSKRIKSTATASLYSWNEIGPIPGSTANYGSIAGRFVGISVDPTNSNTIFAAAADGGVWKTTNAGTSWTPTSDFQPTLASGGVAVDPSDPNVLYYATGESYPSIDAYGGAGILKSTDAGTTWSVSGLTNEDRIPKVAVDPFSSSNVIAASWGGVYRSTNAGGSWTEVLNASSAYDVNYDPSNSQIVYATIGDNSSNAGVWKSTDGGASWTKTSTGLPASGTINNIELSICESAPWIIYTVMSKRSPYGEMNGVFKSTDAGATWTNLNGPTDLFGNQGWYDICIAVSPTDSNLCFVGGIDTWKTSDGGTSWFNMTNGYAGGNTHVDHHDLVFDGSTLYLAGDGGIWKTTNTGTTWTNLNSNLAAVQFYDIASDYLTPSRLYGGTQDNGTQRGTGVLPWTGVLGGDGAVSAVDYTNSSTVYAETQNGAHYRSFSGGTSGSFSSIQTGIVGNGAWVTPFIIHPTINTTVFTATSTIYKSTNRGTLWTPQGSFGSTVTVLAYHPNTNKLYAGAGANIGRSTNDGTTFTFINAGLPSRTVTDVEFDLSTLLSVYVTFSGTGSGHVFKSTNEGTAWTDISGDLPDLPVNAMKVLPGNKNKIYVATDLGVYVTTNGGTNWTQETDVPNAGVVDLEITSNNYLVAATHGRGAWKAPLSTAISGTVYKDYDGFTSTTGDRIGSPTWRVRLLSANVQIDSQVVNGTGQYSFSTLANGSYDLVLVPKTTFTNIDAVAGSGGSVETRIDSLRLHVEVSNGQVSSNNDFIVFSKTNISGIKFNDTNGNGLLDGGEPGLSGWIIYLNGPVSMLDTTDGTGAYSFANLSQGIYTLGESLKTGWLVTVPSGGSITDTLNSSIAFGVNFGNYKRGSISGIKFRDTDQDGDKDGSEPLLSDWQIVKQGLSTLPETSVTDVNGNYSFTNLPYDVYTITEIMPGPGWGQTKPGNPSYAYTVTLRSGLDTSDLDFGNFPLDSVKYRTAEMTDWALAQDLKGKYKAEKRKPNKVEVKFNLIATDPNLYLEFSQNFTGTVYRGKDKIEVLATLAGGAKKYTLTGLAVTPPETIQVDGIGDKGKRIKVKYAFGINKKTALTDLDYKKNHPRLPMPNLNNVGEELFVEVGGFGGVGLKVGLGGAHSVLSLKYKDVLKSLNKKGAIHDAAARCLDNFDGTLKPILKQLTSLPRDKHNNKLFAEVIALKLNVKASQLGNMPVGLGDLLYNDTGDVVFNNKSINRIIGQADSFLTNCSVVTPKTATAADYYDVIHAINEAFSDSLDTLSFTLKTVLTGTKYLVDVPLLRPNPLSIEPRIEPANLGSFEEVPLRYALYQNYPNPFNPLTTIEFDLEDQSIVTLKIYNILGQEVATLLDHQLMDDGNQEVQFDGNNISSGVYFYRILAQGFDEDGLTQTFQHVKKMLLVK